MQGETHTQVSLGPKMHYETKSEGFHSPFLPLKILPYAFAVNKPASNDISSAPKRNTFDEALRYQLISHRTADSKEPWHVTRAAKLGSRVDLREWMCLNVHPALFACVHSENQSESEITPKNI